MVLWSTAALKHSCVIVSLCSSFFLVVLHLCSQFLSFVLITCLFVGVCCVSCLWPPEVHQCYTCFFCCCSLCWTGHLFKYDLRSACMHEQALHAENNEFVALRCVSFINFCNERHSNTWDRHSEFFQVNRFGFGLHLKWVTIITCIVWVWLLLLFIYFSNLTEHSGISPSYRQALRDDLSSACAHITFPSCPKVL